MLTTFIASLQSLISSRFLMASFFPSLAFCFINAVLMFFLNSPFQEYIISNVTQTAGLAALLMTAALIGVTLFAYAEFSLLPSFQAFLEGNWPSWAVFFFAPSQTRRHERLNRELAENRKLRGSFGTPAGKQTQAEAWKSALMTARRAGNASTTNMYRYTAASAKKVEKLDKLRRSSRRILSNAINVAVAEITMDLRVNNADIAGPDNDSALENVRQTLYDLITYSDQYAAAEYRSLVTRRQFSFGLIPLAPTLMGNVAKTVQSYAISCYEFNFELFWSRLQLIAQRDKDFGATLQAAKTQLDFLISCSILTYAATLPWALWLLLTHGPVLIFVAIALLGPLAGYVWYRVAVAQYRTLADLLRSSIDLFRLDLLVALHYPVPDGVDAERFLWEKVDALHLLHEIRDLKLSPPKS